MKNNWHKDLDGDWIDFIIWPVVIVIGLAIIFLLAANPSF